MTNHKNKTKKHVKKDSKKFFRKKIVIFFFLILILAFSSIFIFKRIESNKNRNGQKSVETQLFSLSSLSTGAALSASCEAGYTENPDGSCVPFPAPVSSYSSFCNNNTVNVSWGASSGTTYYYFLVRDDTAGGAAIPHIIGGTSYSGPGITGHSYNTSVSACNDPSQNGSGCSGPVGEPYGVPFTCKVCTSDPTCGGNRQNICSTSTCTDSCGNSYNGAASQTQGKCGTDSGANQVFITAPTSTSCNDGFSDCLCQDWSSPSVSMAGNSWTWTCSGTCNGGSQNCNATRDMNVREVAP